MDIITHTLSGMAVGTVAANFTKGNFTKKLFIVTVGTIAGALPDIDVITMWGGFDGTFGKLFNLSISGQEAFSAKLWYSHHAFFHSIIAALLFGMLFGLIIYRYVSSKQVNEGVKSRLKYIAPFVIAFVFGYGIHIVEDMVTPGGGWGGVAFWWPSETYSGGWGDIWWWNNYDIFLLLLGL